MAPQATDVWKDVLPALERDLGQERFCQWFLNVSLAEYDGETATLSVPNQVVRTWISEKYTSILQTLFLEITGQSPRLFFRVDAAHSSLLGQSSRPTTSPPVPRTRGGVISEVRLNSNYTFSQFVVGPSNRLAHAASVAVAENPSNAYNPFFLHGAVGLGKTHLLQAICHELVARRPELSIHFLTCESFLNQYVYALQHGKLLDFRSRYRDIDVLVIDDIHFLASKQQTQEEFFHTFNTLTQHKKQVVLSSDCPPVEIPTLEERLVSRFKMGLVTKIESPLLETRIAILKQKTHLQHLSVTDEGLHFIAGRITANIRELEGAINILSVEARSLNSNIITLDMVKNALRDFLPSASPTISMSRILDVVVEEFGLKFADLQSKRRTKSIAFPRQICMYLAKKLTNSSLEEIGSYLGGKDHSTVIYAIEKIQRLASTDSDLSARLERLSRNLLRDS